MDQNFDTQKLPESSNVMNFARHSDTFLLGQSYHFRRSCSQPTVLFRKNLQQDWGSSFLFNIRYLKTLKS